MKPIRFALAAMAVCVFGPLGALAAVLVNPFVGRTAHAYASIAAQTLTNKITDNADAQEILWEHKILQSAAVTSPFADNMTGGIGSGKPFIAFNDTTKVAGQEIVIPTMEEIGGRGVQGSGERVGHEVATTDGSFRLKIDLWWCGLGIENKALAFSVHGKQWDNVSADLLSRRLKKKQNSDKLMVLRGASSDTAATTVFPLGKSLDTLLSADTFSTAILTRGRGQLIDNGGLAMNVNKPTDSVSGIPLPPLNRYLAFTTDQNARPIKSESAYLEGIRLAKERGSDNNLFTGEYQTWDNVVVYPWQVINHAAKDSIGSPIQPDAKLGTAIVAKGTSTSLAVNLDGGGSAANAALTEIDWFEFFRLFAYVPIHGTTITIGTGTRYFAIINNTDGKLSFFSYTGNTGLKLTGLTRLGSTIAGDYNTTVGGVTWNSGSFTTAADGLGYQGVTEGVIPIGSSIYECNSKGVPLGEAFILGEMAGVFGYGSLPTGEKMAAPTKYEAPHRQARASGLEIAYGTKSFARAGDGINPNMARCIFARSIAGFPIVES